MNRYILKTTDGKLIETVKATDLTDAALIVLDKLGYSLTMHENDAFQKKIKNKLTPKE